MIFVDTGAWYARFVIEDVDHARAAAWFNSPPDLLLTTDYVVDELLTLLKVRGYADIAFTVGAPLLVRLFGTDITLVNVASRENQKKPY